MKKEIEKIIENHLTLGVKFYSDGSINDLSNQICSLLIERLEKMERGEDDYGIISVSVEDIDQLIKELKDEKETLHRKT